MSAIVGLQPHNLSIKTPVRGVRLTQHVEEYSYEGHQFRWDAFYAMLRYGHAILGGVQNVTHAFEDDAWGDPRVFGAKDGFGLYLATHSEIPNRMGTHIDGAEIAYSRHEENWGRGFENTDALGWTSKSLYTRKLLAVPYTVTWELLYEGTVRNPEGSLSRSHITGTWVPLVGEYARWSSSVTVNGAPSLKAYHYLRADVASELHAPYLKLHPEWFGIGTQPLSTAPCRVKWTDVELLDRRDRWKEVRDWRIYASFVDGPEKERGETQYGWAATDGLISSVGHPEDAGLERGLGAVLTTRRKFRWWSVSDWVERWA